VNDLPGTEVEDPFEDADDGAAAPWFEAGFDSDDDSCCGEGIYAGEIIRADGQGGYEHQDCVESEQLNAKSWSAFTPEPGFGYHEEGDYT
jgi:hypothetical protein